MKARIIDGFSTSEAALFAKVPYTTVDYWARTKLVVPSIAVARGTGSDRLYSFKDLIALRAIKELRENGTSTQALRKVVRYLRSHGWPDPLADCRLIKIGKEVCFVRGFRELEAVLRQPGQGLFAFMLDFGRIEQEISEKVDEHRAA